jgi:hypothetical protein
LGIFFIALTTLFYLQVLTRSDLDHLVITAPPAWVLLAWLSGNITSSSVPLIEAGSALRPIKPVFKVTWVATVLVILVIAQHLALPPLIRDGRQVNVARAGLYLSNEMAGTVEQVVGQLRQHASEEESVLVLPYHPVYYFLAERRDPTRWGYLWPGDQTDADHRELIAQARRDPPAIIVVHDLAGTRSYAGPVIDWIESEYAAIDPESDPVIFLPRSAASTASLRTKAL